MDCSPPGSSIHGDSPDENTEVGCHFLSRRLPFPSPDHVALLKGRVSREMESGVSLQALVSLISHSRNMQDLFNEFLISHKRSLFMNCCWIGVSQGKSSPYRKSILNTHWKDWCWSSDTMVTWCKEPIHWKRHWCFERFEGKRKKGVTEREMVRWYHWLNGHEFEQILGDSEGLGSLACCSPWSHKESDMT